MTSEILSLGWVDELLAAAQSDLEAPFTEEVLERLSLLQEQSPSAFENCRRRLKDLGCRVTALDKQLARRAPPSSPGGEQAVQLIALASDAELFHTADLMAYADLNFAGHRQTWPIRSEGFRLWLGHRYYQAFNGAPGSDALSAALNVLEARARFDGPERSVHVRACQHEGRVYLDLCDDGWRTLQIDQEGRRVQPAPPVRFRRSPGMLPLPEPVQSRDIGALRLFLNVASDEDFQLAVFWLLAALRGRGPYPVLVLSGEQGSAKSTFASVMRSIIDPNTAPLRALPREDRELFIASGNALVLAFDNVSGLPPWLSDTLCRLATGGGFSVRKLYTDQGEILFSASRPIILNGIEDIITRPDLADRGLFLRLEPISRERRIPEEDFWDEFRKRLPSILGALLEGVSEGMRNLPKTRPIDLPRMADFAVWATACESAYWPSGTFAAAYRRNRAEAVDGVIDSDPVASAVRAYMATRPEWSGTATELLCLLGPDEGERHTRSKGWPETPRGLSGRLRRAATFLREIGIDVETGRASDESRSRIITITNVRFRP